MTALFGATRAAVSGLGHTDPDLASKFAEALSSYLWKMHQGVQDVQSLVREYRSDVLAVHQHLLRLKKDECLGAVLPFQDEFSLLDLILAAREAPVPDPFGKRGLVNGEDPSPKKARAGEVSPVQPPRDPAPQVTRVDPPSPPLDVAVGQQSPVLCDTNNEGVTDADPEPGAADDATATSEEKGAFPVSGPLREPVDAKEESRESHAKQRPSVDEPKAKQRRASPDIIDLAADTPVDNHVQRVFDACKLSLRDAQRDAVIRLQQRPGLVVSFATGVGKTLVAVVAAQVEISRNSERQIIVVAPLATHDAFETTIKKAGFEAWIGNYSFYSYQMFARRWKDGELDTTDAFLIFDEAHNIRTQIYTTLRSKINSIVKMKPSKMDEKYKAIQQNHKRIRLAIKEAARMDKVDVIDFIRGETGVDVRVIASAALAAVTASLDAYKTLQLTATPLFNDTEDFANLVSIALKCGVLAPKDVELAASTYNYDFDIEAGRRRKRIREMYFRGTFVFCDHKEDDPNFPKLVTREHFITMSGDCYAKYHEFERQQDVPWETGNVWTFYSGVRQATNVVGQSKRTDDNDEDMRDVPGETQKANYICERVEAEPLHKTLIHSTFVTRGTKYLQQLFDARRIKWVEITGCMAVKDRLKSVDTFNSPTSTVNVMFVTDAGSEGLDLKRVTRGYLFEPGRDRPWRSADRALRLELGKEAASGWTRPSLWKSFRPSHRPARVRVRATHPQETGRAHGGGQACQVRR